MHRLESIVVVSGKDANAQLEERIGDLQHQYMRMPMIVDNEDALNRPPHAPVLIVVLQALQTRRDRRVFLRLRLFRTNSRRGI
jgi:hypothetical protein